MADRDTDGSTDLARLTPKERLGEQIATLAARIDAATCQPLVLEVDVSLPIDVKLSAAV